MGAPTKFDFAFGRSLRRGAGKIGCLIDVAFGVIYLRHMWNSPAGRAAIIIFTLPMVFVLLIGNILVFLLLAAAYPMLARWIMPLVGLFTGWLFSEGDPSDTAADSLDKDSSEE